MRRRLSASELIHVNLQVFPAPAAPVAGQRQMHHRLPQLGFSGGVFDKIHVVEDIHQVLGFGDAPEDLRDTGTQLPQIAADVAEQEKIRLAQVKMGASRIGIVVPQERCEREAPASGVLYSLTESELLLS